MGLALLEHLYCANPLRTQLKNVNEKCKYAHPSGNCDSRFQCNFHVCKYVCNKQCVINKHHSRFQCNFYVCKYVCNKQCVISTTHTFKSQAILNIHHYKFLYDLLLSPHMRVKNKKKTRNKYFPLRFSYFQMEKHKIRKAKK